MNVPRTNLGVFRHPTTRGDTLSTTSALGGPQGFAVGERRDQSRVFALAARHSRRVRLLRRAIPVAIVAMLAAIVAVSWLDPLKVLVRLPIDAGKLVVSGTRITMQAPKLSGYTKDHRWYEVSAEGATQDITKPDLIELAEVRAKIEAQDKSTTFIATKDGLYNRRTSLLTLKTDVLLRSTAGYEMHLEEASIDTGKGEVVSEKPVSVFTKDSTLTSDRFEVENSGEVVRFIGGVVMHLENVGKDAQSAAKPQEPAGRR